jgi:hypothetical protein
MTRLLNGGLGFDLWLMKIPILVFFDEAIVIVTPGSTK